MNSQGGVNQQEIICYTSKLILSSSITGMDTCTLHVIINPKKYTTCIYILKQNGGAESIVLRLFDCMTNINIY